MTETAKCMTKTKGILSNLRETIPPVVRLKKINKDYKQIAHEYYFHYVQGDEYYSVIIIRL